MDYRLLQRGPVEPGPEVVIVAVDNESLDAVGRWPWPRTIFGQLIDLVSSGDPAVIGLDVVFSEPSAFRESKDLSARASDIDAATWTTVQEALRAQDRALAASLRNSGHVVGGYFFAFEVEQGGAEADPIGETPSTYDVVRGSPGGRGEKKIPASARALRNLPAFAEAALDEGYFNVTHTGGDGLIRRVPLAIRHGDNMAVPLSLAMLRAGRPNWKLAIHFVDFGVGSIRAGEVDVPVSEDGHLLVNYRGPGQTFPHISAAGVLDGSVDPAVFRDKLVVLGITATAVADIRVTPFDKSFPGVEVHANVLDNILPGDFLHRPRTLVIMIEVAVIFALALLLGIGLGRLRGVWAALLAFVLSTAYLAGSQWLFVSRGMPLSVVYPLLTIAVTYTAIALQHFMTEERERRKMRRALELYLSPSMATMVSEHPDLLKLGGDKQQLTVFFSDIRGFTSISEKLDPQELVELLNEYLEAMTEIVFAHDGMLDKYIGDAVMAVWGAPLEQPDHARRACQATVEMVQRLEELNAAWEPRGWPRLEIGIGLNTGQMVFGNMGSSKHLSLTVMGDNVNLGSRLEGLNKNYGTHSLVSEATVTAAGNGIVAREIDLVRVKGKFEPVGVYELLATHDDGSWESVLQLFAAGLEAYRARQWDEAETLFAQVQRDRGEDGPSRLYIQRCQAMRANPPGDDWYGVTVMETK
jgi:adenylate cyclase